jgi:hypothetical protein
MRIRLRVTFLKHPISDGFMWTQEFMVLASETSWTESLMLQRARAASRFR